MAARKLQTEIERTLKKVSEGVELFEGIYDKMQASTNQPQKEKLEADLKTQIKKLQRMRDQIKTWCASNEIKDKSALVDNRKLIETQMEKFKACEKEMKTKAFSKEGLIAALKLDPKEKEKVETSAWLSTHLEELARQVEQAEAELETLQGGPKKKGKSNGTAGGRQDELETLNDRRKWHISRLEIILRLIENGTLPPEKVMALKEDISYFVESNTEEDFEEDEGIYDDLNLDEEEEKFGLVTEDGPTDDDSVSNADEQPARTSSKDSRQKSQNADDDASGRKDESPVLKKALPLRRPSDKSEILKPPIPLANFIQQPMASAVKASLSSAPAPAPPRTTPLRYAAAAATAVNNSAASQPHAPSAQASATAAREPSTALSSSAPAPLPAPVQATNASAVPSSSAPAASNSSPPTTSSPSLTHPSLSAPSPILSSAGNAVDAQSTSQLSRTTPPPAAAAGGSGSIAGGSFYSRGSSPVGSSIPDGGSQLLASPDHDRQQKVGSQGAASPQALRSPYVSQSYSTEPASTAPLQNGFSGPFQSGSTQAAIPLTLKEQLQQQQPLSTQSSSSTLPQTQPPYQQPSAQTTQPQGIPASWNMGQSGSTSLTYNSSSPFANKSRDSLDEQTSFPQRPGPPGQPLGGTIGATAQQQQESSQPRLPGSLSDLVASFESAKQKAAHRMSNLDQVHKVLEAGLTNIPQPQDTEKPKYYVPRHPYITPQWYPQQPSSLLNNTGVFSQLDVETLFYVFYYLPGSYQQYLAAKELKRQSWRFHVKYLTWFQRHSEPQAITDEYEQGVYVYFDWEGSWCQRKKSDFRFEYRYLSED